MKYFSTRGDRTPVSAAAAIVRGLAPDGGLYVPERLPRYDLNRLRSLAALDYQARAVSVMGDFLEEFSTDELSVLSALAYGRGFDKPEVAPVRFTDGRTGYLELWHGPTCAFKDMALQLLPHLLTASLAKCGETRQVCILVATSGDTGKAALEGFADVPGTKILVFYPRDGVSDVQRLQMVTQQGDNVRVCAVHGNFDDAQTAVKTIFGDRVLAQRLSERGWFLSSANSINWGRLLPQIVYYFSAYCDCVAAGKLAMGEKLDFCVPTGNFGDILAGWYAGRMGLPVGKLICASNENNVLTDFIRTGVYDRRRDFHVTASPSMDILVSSSLERLLYHLTGSGEETAGYLRALGEQGRYQVGENVRLAMERDFAAYWCDDARAAGEIAKAWREQGYLMDTHTAVAAAALADYRAETGETRPAVVVSTASPFKFCDSVLEALGEPGDAPGTALLSRLSEKTGTSVPAPLAGLGQRTERFSQCAEKEALRAVVEDFLL